MDTLLPHGVIWWITVVDIPALAGLLTFIWRTRRDFQAHILDLQQLLDTRHSQLRENLAAYKLEAIKSYASVTDVKDLEKRLVAHLLRIEEKLDRARG